MGKLFVFSVFLALVSCQEPATIVATNVDGVITVNTKDVKDTVDLKLTELVENVEVVLLDPKIEAYVPEGYPVAISENYIVVSDNNNVKLFDRKTGKFITNIISKGNGPDEFKFFINYNIVNEERNTIYMVDYIGARNILEFDLQGNFKRKIPLADNRAINYTKFLIDEENGVITVYSVPYNSVVWKQDFEGKFLTDRAVLLHRKENFNFHNSTVIDNTFNLFLNKYYNRQDTLYKYDKENHKINPIFTVRINEFSETDVVDDTKRVAKYFETSDKFITTLFSLEMQIINNRIASSDIHYVKHLIVNKKDLTGNYADINNDYLFNDKIDRVSTSNGYMYKTYSTERLMKIIENATDEDRKNTDPKVLKQIDELYEKLDEESNTTIFLGKLK